MNETKATTPGGGGVGAPTALRDGMPPESSNDQWDPEWDLELGEVPAELSDPAFWEAVTPDWVIDAGRQGRLAVEEPIRDDVPPLADLGPDGLLDELQAAWRAQAAAQARQARLITELTMRRS